MANLNTFAQDNSLIERKPVLFLPYVRLLKHITSLYLIESRCQTYLLIALYNKVCIVFLGIKYFLQMAQYASVKKENLFKEHICTYCHLLIEKWIFRYLISVDISASFEFGILWIININIISYLEDITNWCKKWMLKANDTTCKIKQYISCSETSNELHLN